MPPTAPAPAPRRAAPARATIADVAAQAGVSKATVSRFLNGRTELLTPDIAERVRAAIAELHYHPSPMAQALKHGRSRLIGLVVADVTNPFSVAVLQGAEKACQAAGYLLVLFNLGNEPGREREALQAVQAYQLDGLILNRVDTNVQLWQPATEHGKPIVLVDRFQAGLDADFVSVDNAAIVHLALEHLLANGFGELLLVSEPTEGVSSRAERRTTFEAAQAAQPAPGRWRGDYWESPGNEPADVARLAERLRRLVDQGRARGAMPAVLASNAIATLRVATAAQHAGLALGRDLGFVGIDETDWAGLIGPGLTTIAQPTDALGQAAARCLIERLHGLQEPARTLALPGTLIARGSSQPLNH
ncbi:LacI family DNA-binding transcriptional regulator [Comamonas humi]